VQNPSFLLLFEVNDCVDADVSVEVATGLFEINEMLEERPQIRRKPIFFSKFRDLNEGTFGPRFAGR